MVKRKRIEIDHIGGPLNSDPDAIFPDNFEAVKDFIERGVEQLQTLMEKAEVQLSQQKTDVIAEQAVVRELGDKFYHLFSDNMRATLEALSSEEDKDNLKKHVRTFFDELREELQKIMRIQKERENARREANISEYGSYIEEKIFGKEER